MPLKRTPPKTQQVAGSDTTSNVPTDTDNESTSNAVTRTRTRKRQHDDELTVFMREMKDTFEKFKKEQDQKYTMLLSSVNAIKDQNSEIKIAMDFISKQYDDMEKKLASMTSERKVFQARIQQLESKIDTMERSQKGTSIEVKNIPPIKGESKTELLKLVDNISQTLNMQILNTEIRDIYRINTKNVNNKPIIVDFTSAIAKEKLLSRVKQYNKDNKDCKLNTSHFHISGPQKPIYITENLTAKCRKLYAQAREYAKMNDYSFCWISSGRVFLRQKEGTTHLRIDTEEDLAKLKSVKSD